MYDVLNACLEGIIALGQGYCLQYFWGSFLESRGKNRRVNGLLVMVVYGVLRLGVNFILTSDYESVKTVEKLTLTLCIIILLTLLFYKGAHAIVAFLVVTFMAVNEITFFLSYMLMQIGGSLFDLWLWLMEKGYIASSAVLEWFVPGTVVVLQLLSYSIYLVLLYFSLRKIIEDFLDKDYRVQRTELYFLLLPGAVGLLICVLLKTIMITIENDVPRLLYDKYPILAIVVPAMLLLSLMSIVYGVKTFQNMITLNREKNSRIILEKQIGNMQGHIEEMERMYSGVQSMKHDMKNTLAVIMQLAAKEEEDLPTNGLKNAKLQAYLAELNHSFDPLEFQFKTGNTVADTLLNMKYHEAIRMIPGIQIHAERLLFSEGMHIRGYDIGVIIGNALDNATEACMKLKAENQEAEAFIRLSTFKRGKMVFIEVENSFNGKIEKRKQSEFPLTDKADKKAHGIGLVNIKHTAEKYHGAVDWSVNEKVFTLSVMMKDERRTENEY